MEGIASGGFYLQRAQSPRPAAIEAVNRHCYKNNDSTHDLVGVHDALQAVRYGDHSHVSTQFLPQGILNDCVGVVVYTVPS